MKQAILSVPWLAANFDIGEKYIRTIDKTVTYVFAGLRHNLDSIKSKARILLCWVDEAESVSEIAWQKLSPTVREEGSKIWVTWNPERDVSATDKRFRKEAGDDCITVEMNYRDNPWFPDVLECGLTKLTASPARCCRSWLMVTSTVGMASATVSMATSNAKPKRWG